MILNAPDILIAEDEPLNRDVMKQFLIHKNLSNLRFAEDGQQALDMVKVKKPDLLLLDVMMPEIMGLQVLHTLRETYSMVELPIIMVTAINEDQRIVRALELGANDYVTKPINFPILIARIQTQLTLTQLSLLNAEFINTASHDMRKPLTYIRDLANKARLKLASNEMNAEDIMKNMTSISESAAYVQNIADCVLNMQASGLGQIQLTKSPVNLTQLANEVIERHRERANEKKIGLITKYSEEKLVIEADRTRISQVMDNCVGNAIKFCSNGDMVTISIKSSGDMISTEISDTGPGLSDSDLKNLFIKGAKFSNKATDGEDSNGLGLPICKELIDLHDGSIGAYNNLQNGASFWFNLPMLKLKPVE
ncbi:MAG: hybrid sensor histidine kinase/response regulator [Gammaproteobacteria bacterium]|nr:hybrid sensor histidine kinase/response regulator [Gammaproteobacteria bacterium]MCW9004013.1 hybrid sensor histidine kinase/response regulator [Gammaproteobacteria bacterium]MCW9056345.1 hybrid sensor histidine kinase/response regulator [Gammaproteobacteria bacterium]